MESGTQNTLIIFLTIVALAAIGLATYIQMESRINLETISELEAQLIEKDAQINTLNDSSLLLLQNQETAEYELKLTQKKLEEINKAYPRLYNNFLDCFWGSYGALSPSDFAEHFEVNNPTQSIEKMQWDCLDYQEGDWELFLDIKNSIVGVDVIG